MKKKPMMKVSAQKKEKKEKPKKGLMQTLKDRKKMLDGL